MLSDKYINQNSFFPPLNISPYSSFQNTHFFCFFVFFTIPFWPKLKIPSFFLSSLKMVKFSKQFEGQLVPEWKEAFVDYWQLKKDLKKIHLHHNNSNANQKKKTPQNSLANTIFSFLHKFSLLGRTQQREHKTIQVNLSLSFTFFTFVFLLPRKKQRFF